MSVADSEYAVLQEPWEEALSRRNFAHHPDGRIDEDFDLVRSLNGQPVERSGFYSPSKHRASNILFLVTALVAFGLVALAIFG